VARKAGASAVMEPRRPAIFLFWCTGTSLVLGNLPCADGMASICPLSWNSEPSLPGGINKTAVCPYGRQIPKFDVTVPHGTTVFSVNGICVFWGLIPFAVVGFGVVDAILRSITLRGIGTRELSFLSFVLVMVGLNELAFKKLAMEPRPDRSCNTSCGFPSGHATMACGFFMLMFLDAVFRTMPRVPLNIHDARAYQKALAGQRRRFFGWTFKELVVIDCRACITLMPLSAAHTLNQTDFALYAITWGLLLLPVPFSRVVLYDHTPQQVMVGSAIGIFEALLFFGLVRSVQHRVNHNLGRRLGGILVHDFPLPMYEVQSKCYRLLADIEDNGCTKTLMQDLRSMHRELSWYINQLEPNCLWVEEQEDSLSADREAGKLRRMQDEIAARLGQDPEVMDSPSESSSDTEAGYGKW